MAGSNTDDMDLLAEVDVRSGESYQPPDLFRFDAFTATYGAGITTLRFYRKRSNWEVAKHRPVPSHATAGLPQFACDECGDWWPCVNSSDWTIDNPDEAEALRHDEGIA